MIFNGTSWIVELDWNRASALNWAPVTSRNYIVAVWVRNSGVTADAAQAMTQVNYVIGSSSTTISSATAASPLSVTSLTSTLGSPQQENTSISFTATATGGAAPYQFKWWVYDGSSWWVAQDWSTSQSFTWRPSAAGSYIVAVWARNAGVTADASQAMSQMDYAVTSATSWSSFTTSSSALTVSDLTTNLLSPQSANTSIAFTANVTGGASPYQYKW